MVGLKRYESLSLHNVLHHLKINDVHWLPSAKAGSQRVACPPQERLRRKLLLAQWLAWTINHFIFPLLMVNELTIGQLLYN